jgi:hypothetical protein
MEPEFNRRTYQGFKSPTYIYVPGVAFGIETIQSDPGGRVIVSAILSKEVYMYMCPIPNGFRDRAISLYRRATRHVLTRVAKCIEVYGEIWKIYCTR